jgi:hypothetical protein
MTAVRSILAVLAGAVVAFAVIAGLQALGTRVYPPPPDIDFNDRQQVAALIAQAPLGALLLVLAAYAAGTLAGAWVAVRLSGRAPFVHATVIGALFLLASVANLILIPHPPWFAVAALILFLPAAWLAAMMGGKRGAAAA